MVLSNPRRNSFFQETTKGTPPANAAAWVSSGSSIYTINQTPDLTPLRQSILDDLRTRQTLKGHFPKIAGIKGGVEVSFETYLTGSGDSSRADADTTAAHAFLDLMEHAFGSIDRPTSHLASGTHSTTTVELDSVAGVSEGSWLGFPHPTSGLIYKRQVTDITGTVCTLHQDLPFTPSDSDLIRGLASVAVNESVLGDAAAGPYTFSWLFEVGTSPTAREAWEARGCVSFPTGITLERNQAPVLAWNTLVGGFIGPDDTTPPTWTAAPAGEAGRVIGVNTHVFLTNVGSTTGVEFDVAACSINPAITRTAVDVQTSSTANMPGRYSYSLDESQGSVELTLVPHADSLWDAFQAETLKQFYYERLGTDGEGWGIYCPRVQIAPDPAYADVNSFLGNALELHMLRGQATSGGNLRNSYLQIVFG